MRLVQIGEAIEKSKITQWIGRALSSYFFPLVTAAVTLGCYYLGWEIVTVWYMCICGTAVMVCCKDVTPVISIFLFFNIFVSLKHCPGYQGAESTYFVSPAILAQEIIGVVFFFGSLIFRVVKGIIGGKFKITPVFWGLVALCCALTLSGLFYSHYVIMNFLYGLALSAVLLGVYVFTFVNVETGENSLKKIAYYFLILFAAVTIQLLVAYATYDGLIVDGRVDRSKLFFGWGMYNNMGLLLTFCIPAWFYLAGKFKYGVFFLLGALFDVAACFLCMSRQAMLMSVVVFVACCVWLLIWDKGKKRLINAAVLGGVALIGIILVIILREKFAKFFSTLLNALGSGSGRTDLWKQGMNNFLHKPLFGVGFYDPLAQSHENGLNDVGYFENNLGYSIPRMCHNTIFQLLSACGLAGFITYIIHRMQTVISLFNNLTNERVFIAMTLCALLLVSLLDNHLFYFMPTIVYAIFVALLAKTEKKDKSQAQKAIT